MDDKRLAEIERKIRPGGFVMIDVETTSNLCRDIRDLISEVRRLRELIEGTHESYRCAPI